MLSPYPTGKPKSIASLCIAVRFKSRNYTNFTQVRKLSSLLSTSAYLRVITRSKAVNPTHIFFTRFPPLGEGIYFRPIGLHKRCFALAKRKKFYVTLSGINFFAMLEKGNPMPVFSAQDQNGNIISSRDLIGKKTVVYFYPKANTPGCTAEACSLRDNYEKFLALGYNVIGISKDSVKAQKNFSDKYTLPFPLLSDTDALIIKAFGAWGEKKLYGKVYEGILRKTFIFDEKGILVDVIDKVNTKNHAEQILG